MENEILKRLYEWLMGQHNMENPFITSEMIRGNDRFLKKYFGDDTARIDEVSAQLEDMHDAVRQRAFETGFYTAVDLLMR